MSKQTFVVTCNNDKPVPFATLHDAEEYMDMYENAHPFTQFTLTVVNEPEPERTPAQQ